jgi:hypothetical protein
MRQKRKSDTITNCNTEAAGQGFYMRQTRNLLERSANPDLSGKLEPSLIFVLPLLLVLLTLPSGVYARTLLVGVDFSTIGNALKEATDGDLIEVRGGEYKGGI